MLNPRRITDSTVGGEQSLQETRYASPGVLTQPGLRGGRPGRAGKPSGVTVAALSPLVADVYSELVQLGAGFSPIAIQAESESRDQTVSPGAQQPSLQRVGAPAFTMPATRFPGAGGIRALQLGNEKRTPALVQTLAPLWANQVTPPSAIPSSGMGLGQWDGTRPSPLVVGTPPISVEIRRRLHSNPWPPFKTSSGFPPCYSKPPFLLRRMGVRRREKGVAPKRRVGALDKRPARADLFTQEPAFSKERPPLARFFPCFGWIGHGRSSLSNQSGNGVRRIPRTAETDPAIVPRQLGQGTELEAGRIQYSPLLPLWLQGQPNIAAQASRMEWLTSSPPEQFPLPFPSGQCARDSSSSFTGKFSGTGWGTGFLTVHFRAREPVGSNAESDFAGRRAQRCCPQLLS